MKKQITAIFTAALILGGLTACSNGANEPGNSTQDISSTSNGEEKPNSSVSENSQSGSVSDNSSSDFDYDYVMEHCDDNLIKVRGIYGETEIPDIHYENANADGGVTHSPFGDEWQYSGLESMEFESHEFGDYTVKLVGYSVRTDKEYFPDRIFVNALKAEVEKNGVPITSGYYIKDVTGGAGAQFYPEELVLTDKIGSYLDVYDLEYPVISLCYYFPDNPKRNVFKAVNFAYLKNDECACDFLGSCEPGCGVAWNFGSDTTIDDWYLECNYVSTDDYTICRAALFEAEKFKVVDKNTLFDEETGITYTFLFNNPEGGVLYAAEKNVGSIATAAAQAWPNAPHA